MVILLVDDNSAIRSSRAELLRAQKHEVIEANTAVEAVHWAQNSSVIDLLITEVILGEGHFGFDLSEAILAKLPAMRTLYTTRFDLTGYEQDMRGASALPATATPEAFLAAVASALMQQVQEEPVAMAIPVEDAPIMPPGTMLGQYQIIDRLYTEPEAETYRAMQHTVQRPVGLVLMKPHLLTNADAVREFKERERVKAKLTHPRIAPLYEAGEANGWLFYTREMPPGKSLQDIATEGGQLSERVLVDVLYRVAEAMSYAVERGNNYRTLNARDIYVDDEHQASIVNIFRPAAALPRDMHADVQSLLDLLVPFVSQGKARGLLHELASQHHDWATLEAKLEGIRNDMSERSLIHRAADEDIAVAPPPARHWPVLVIAGLVLMVVVYLGMWSGSGPQQVSIIADDTIANELVKIPKGEFIFQKSQRLRLPDFWISKYEVTIGQYADFLAALKTSPAGAFDDKNQPAAKRDHIPADWTALYAAAKNKGMFNKQAVSLNTPISGVSYWDAVAYAKWLGQRLPSEQEWEKAARGTTGNLYPWGNQPKADAANLGDDYLADGTGGKVDGYNLWSPVDKPPGDVSAFGVQGMAGNVGEWTTGDDPDVPGRVVPVVRGGHFAMKSSPGLLTDRRIPDDPGDSTLARGFRTVSDKGK